MSTRKHTTRSRILAITTATLFAIGGGMATTATSGAQPTPAPQPAPSAPPSAAEAAHIAAHQAPAPSVGEWSAEHADTSNYDPTERLSAILLSIDGATASSPQQVALFEHGNYIGTTQPEAYAFQHVERVASSVIKIDYRYLLPGDANANPRGLATSHYILGPDDVTRTGELPPTE